MKRGYSIQILDFTHGHLQEATHLAQQAYDKARGMHPVLPELQILPEWLPDAGSGLGVAALEGGRLVGYLLCSQPFPHAFGSTDATGVFSPLQATGILPAYAQRIRSGSGLYTRMYQAAGEKWRAAGASSHGICTYAHDLPTQMEFFRLGFGCRCVDGIRAVQPLFQEVVPSDTLYVELEPESFPLVLPLAHLLDRHMAASPIFIRRPSLSEAAFIDQVMQQGGRLWAAKRAGKVVAFLGVEREGETFIDQAPGYLHITRAFCLPQERGTGLMSGLLDFVLRTLGQEGTAHLGVDYESMNPQANGFWQRHFTPYTYGLVRRIDEHALHL